MRAKSQSVSEIVAAVGLPLKTSEKALASDLENLTNAFRLWRAGYDRPPSKSKNRNQLQEIKKLAKRLAYALGVSDGKDIRDIEQHLFVILDQQAEKYAQRKGPYPEVEPTPYDSDAGERFTDYGGAQVVLQATQGVWRLYEWARAGLKEMEAEEYQHWPPDGPSAEAWLISKEIPEIYERNFGQSFGVSKSSTGTGSPYGPGIRFAEAFLTQLGIPKSPDAIAKAWQRHRQQWDKAPNK